MSPAPARAAVRLLCAAAVLASLRARADDVYADGRDAWNLFEQKLLNRQLEQQLDDDRFGNHLGWFSTAADVWVGAQVARSSDDLSRFHGFFVADTFGQARLGTWLDIDLNVTVTNPSASDGYRFSSFVLPGLALHVHHDLFWLKGDPVHLDIVTPDLDLVTTGEGLLVENLPLEGYRGTLTWRGLALSTVFGGQVYFADDDYTTWMLTALNGRVGLQGTLWDLPSALDPLNGLPDTQSPTKDVYYFGAFAHWPLFEHARVAAEGAARVDGSMLRYGALLRADWMQRGLDKLDLHLGWQFRYYGKRFTPQTLDEMPHTSPSLPSREEAYVTNAFEYFYLSREYDQWSHTGMAEARLLVWRRLTAVVEAEEWLRFITDPDPLPRVTYSGTSRVPGIVPAIYYRAGIEWAFQSRGQFRGMLMVTNKTVNSAFDITEPVAQRFSYAPVLLLRFVAKL